MEPIETRVETLLEKVRPYIQMHGGDVHLLKVDGPVATLKVYGACVDCSLASVTYTKMIGPLVVKEIDEIEEVVFE